MKYAYGIDLGTTYSCIAYVDEFGKPVVLKNSAGASTTPSVVYVESASNIVVGEEAKRMLELEADKTVQFIKRKMGKEKNTVKLNGTTYTAQEISGYILKKLVDDANAELQQTGVLKDGEEIKDVVITCPAYFGMNEKNATKEAGVLAGLNVLDIINEPTAAAISYGVSGQEREETVLVYDLGGGTFDITVMNINGGNITVICSGGDDQLGGKDWDEALMNYVVEKFQAETGEDLSEDPDAVAALYLDVETWKKSLTSREKVNISVRAMGERMRDELTRAQHEEMTRHLLNRTKNLLDDILITSAAAGYPLSRIDKVLLVGGSSFMPQVAKMIREDYGVEAKLQNPNQAVAEGAAIYAQNQSAFKDFILQEAQRTGKSVEQIQEENKFTGDLDKKFSQLNGGAANNLTITNVLSCTYGVSYRDTQTQKSMIANMLKINDPLPAKKVETFYTASDNQQSVAIRLFETRSNEDAIEMEDREPLTVIDMFFTRAVPKGTPVEITMALDNSGILHVMAVERLTNSKLDTPFELSHQMSEHELAMAGRRVKGANVE